MEKNTDQIQARLQNWFMRKTANRGSRRVGELQLALTSDIGTVRGENQDRLAVLRIQSRSQSFLVAALCDGMGGMADGGLSASISLSSFLAACVRQRDKGVRERILTAAKIANDAVYSTFRGKGGATLSAFIVDSHGGVGGVNVGDSRIYAISPSFIEQLTQDDTIAGQIGGQNSVGDIHGRNDLLQYVGVGPEIEPHFINLSSYSDHSTITLTSDGIHFLDSQIIRSVVTNAEDLGVAAQRLSELSKWCGGKDNASALVASSIKDLTHISDSDLPSVIEVWDSYNEVQIINANIHREFQRNGSSTQSINNSIENQNGDGKAEKKKRKNAAGGNKKKKQVKSDKSPTNSNTDANGKPAEAVDKDKPQLKINFNKNGDASSG